MRRLRRLLIPHAAVRSIDLDTGTVTTLAGSRGVNVGGTIVPEPGATDGVSGAARFLEPADVAVDARRGVAILSSGSTLRQLQLLPPVACVMSGWSNASSGSGARSVCRFHWV